uniref:AlNc14C17G1813 protein n=1 Tax=Albugo laibachii Nc14 TaxID=890382 RepID=F0W4J3_9STRA|nr:AlNc14C17G1813 [Albugo laibachii Nc14]|eukprot:CCA16026.1 AlNc14C17G1813 [Albugo laibachii Nc14]
MEASCRLERLLFLEKECDITAEDILNDFQKNVLRHSSLSSPLSLRVCSLSPLVSTTTPSAAEIFHSVIAQSCGLDEIDISSWKSLEEAAKISSDAQTRSWEDAIRLRNSIFQERLAFFRSRILLFRLALYVHMEPEDTKKAPRSLINAILQSAETLLRQEKLWHMLVHTVCATNDDVDCLKKNDKHLEAIEQVLDVSKLAAYQAHSIREKELHYVKEALYARELLLLVAVFASKRNIADTEWTPNKAVEIIQTLHSTNWTISEKKFHEDTCVDDEFRQLQQEIVHVTTLLCAWILMPDSNMSWQDQDMRKLFDTGITKKLCLSTDNTCNEADRFIHLCIAAAGNRSLAKKHLQILDPDLPGIVKTSASQKLFQYLDSIVNTLVHGRTVGDLGDGECYSFNIPCADLKRIHTNKMLIGKRDSTAQALVYQIVGMNVVEEFTHLFQEVANENIIDQSVVVKTVIPLLHAHHWNDVLYTTYARSPIIKHMMRLAESSLPNAAFTTLSILSEVAKHARTNKNLQEACMERIRITFKDEYSDPLRLGDSFTNQVDNLSYLAVQHGNDADIPTPLWTTIVVSLDTLAFYVQEGRNIDSSCFGVASAFYELLGYLRHWEDASTIIQEITHWIGCVRLRHWWQSRSIPSGEAYLANLLKNEDVSLSVLLHANEKQLASMGITDRHERKTILEHSFDDVESITCKESAKNLAITSDGLHFLVRVCLYSLEVLLVNDEAGEVTRTLTLNSLKALSSLTSIDIAVDTLTHEFGSIGHDTMSARILQSALEGLALSHCSKEAYACFTTALEICWNMTQWCLSSEVKLLDSFCESSSTKDAEVITSIQQVWWTRTIDFVLKTLRDIREGGFLDKNATWSIQTTCYALLDCVLRAHYSRPTCVLQEIQMALRETLAHNLPFLTQLVNTASTLLENGQVTNEISTSEYPFFRNKTDEGSKPERQCGVVERKAFKKTVKNLRNTQEELAALELTVSSVELLQAVFTCVGSESAVQSLEPTSHLASMIMWMAISYGSFKLDRNSAVPIQSIRLARLFSASLKRNRLEPSRVLFHFFLSSEDRHLLSATLYEAFSSHGEESVAMKLEIIQLWSVWLELDADFVALVAFDPESKDAGLSSCVKSTLAALPDVSKWQDPLICTCLSLCRQIWKAAFGRGSKVHQHMIKLLKSSYTSDGATEKSGSQAFWQPLIDTITCTAFTSQVGVQPRQSLTHVHVTWALIFDMMNYEWFYSVKIGSNHLLSEFWKRVVETDLFCRWVRSFARLDLDIARLTDCLQHIVAFCSCSRIGNSLVTTPFVSYMSEAQRNENMLLWQLGLFSVEKHNDSLIRRVTWTNSMIASSLSHQYLVRNWTRFLRLGLSLSSPANDKKLSHSESPVNHPSQEIQSMARGTRQEVVSALLSCMEEAFEISQEANYFSQAYFYHATKLLTALIDRAEIDNAAPSLDPDTCCRVLKLGANILQDSSTIAQQIDMTTETSVSPTKYNDVSILQLWDEVLPHGFLRSTTMGIETRVSLMTACLFVLQDFYMGSPDTFLMVVSQNVIVKLIESCLGGLAHPHHISSEVAQASWALLYQLLHQVGVSTSTLSLNRAAVRLAPVLATMNHHQQGTSAIFQTILEQYDVYEREVSHEKQQQSLQILEGMVALIWNRANREIIRHIFLGSFNLMKWLASEFVPLLLRKLEDQEDDAPRGFVRNVETYERHRDHRAWCLILEIVAGLVHILPSKHLLEEGSLWLLLRYSETYIASAFDPAKMLTSARIQEQQSTVRLLREVVRTKALAKQWRHELPTGYMLLLERCRQTLKRICVLVAQDYGFCNMDASRSNETLKKKLRMWPTPSLKMPLSKQRPLHQHVDPVLLLEKQESTQFYRHIGLQLYETVHLCASIFSHCIPSPQETWIVVDGRKTFDQELQTPIFSNLPPSQAAQIDSEPSIGHLCLAITAAVHQLQEFKAHIKDKTRVSGQLKSEAYIKAIVGSIQACSLFFLQVLKLQLQNSNEQSDAYSEWRVTFEHLVSPEGINSLPFEFDLSLAEQILDLMPSK